MTVRTETWHSLLMTSCAMARRATRRCRARFEIAIPCALKAHWSPTQVGHTQAVAAELLAPMMQTYVTTFTYVLPSVACYLPDT